MNKNRYNDIDKAIRSQLMQYATEKYGGEYEEIFYETAADATQNYVLCLRDSKGRVFNVYEHAKTGKQTDDYIDSIIDNKMREYLLGYLDINITNSAIGAMAVMNVDVDIDVLENMSLEECMDRFGLYSLVFVYHIEGEKGSIYDQGEYLVEIYHKLRNLKTDTIDFNVVVTSGDASGVMDTLQNMRYKYSGNWYSCSGVQEYISAANPQLDTHEDLKCLVKE